MDVVDQISRFLTRAAATAGFRTREDTRQTVYAASEHLRAALRILTDRQEWRAALLTLDCLDALMDKHAEVREAGWDASSAVRAREVSAEVRAALILKIEGSDRPVARSAGSLTETSLRKGSAMSGIAGIEPWVGRAYGQQLPKIMVIGETRYGDWTDAQIVENLCLPSEKSNTWTGFAKAATGDLALTLDNRAKFLQRIVFHNYVVNFQPRIAAESAVASGQRNDPDNQRVLLEMIERYQPSHLIVWGVPNFRTVVAGHLWRARALAEEGLAYAHIAVGSVRTVTIGIKHPAIGFSSRAWAPVLADFLSGCPNWRPSVSAAEAWRAALPSHARPAPGQTSGKTLLLRLVDGQGARPWVVKEYETDDGIALIDMSGQVVRGTFTARTKARVVEALNVLLNDGAFDGVSGFSYHGCRHVAVVRDGRVVLVEDQ